MDKFVLAYSKEQTRFNISKTDASHLMNYLKHLVIEDIFNGLWINKTLEQFITGYEDEY